jgi:DNA-binding HxlR family transcriptional regulator
MDRDENGPLNPVALNGPGFLADCEALVATEIFSSKWAVVVLFALLTGPKRPMELVALSGGLSRKVLFETLRRLHEYGLVSREAHGGSARRVDYTLTPLGLTLQGPIAAMTEWARRHGGAAMQAREAGAAS